MNTFNKTLTELSKSIDKINILDVGCARGAFLRNVKEHFGNIYSVGIDPLNHKYERESYSLGDYTHYIQCAIDDVTEDRQSKFYINSDDQSSSLLEMDFENLSSDKSDIGSKYYVEFADKLKIRSEINVNVTRLDKIVDRFFKDLDIHFLKIDAEGNDLNVVKSLGDYINMPFFIALECSSHINSKIRIFKNGCHIDDVIPFMEKNGYRVYDSYNHGLDLNNLTQMHDIIFKKIN